MAKYTVEIRQDVNGYRCLQIHGLILTAELNAIKNKLGDIYKLPYNKINKKFIIEV